MIQSEVKMFLYGYLVYGLLVYKQYKTVVIQYFMDSYALYGQYQTYWSSRLWTVMDMDSYGYGQLWILSIMDTHEDSYGY